LCALPRTTRGVLKIPLRTRLCGRQVCTARSLRRANASNLWLAALTTKAALPEET
jgi:hypothetical protein